jgi:transposase-like protein
MTDQSGIGVSAPKKATKRAKSTAAQSQEAVAASLVAGASINEVAERFGVQPSLLSTWRRKHAAAITRARPAIKPARFAAVRVKRTPADGVIEIDLTALLREVLAATR